MQNSFRWFYLLFFLSGFPALIYQIVWQRTLFAIYGVNIESVVTVDRDAAIFGGGVFDGWVTTDIHQTDTVIEPLTLSLFHQDPKEVLEVGMSGGAWSEIISNHPQLEKQVIIEINPGYVQVVRRYPAVAPFPSNPKVELVIDDGRRWMLRNRQRKFDMIVMDTIYHWRAHATNLLSVEFLQLARGFLKPGGILYYNTTFSPEAQRTGAVTFPYAYRFGIFMAVSDSPIHMDKERWRRALENYRLEGKPILDLALKKARDLLERVPHYVDTLGDDRYDIEGMETRENVLRRTEGLPIVTDDNMVTSGGATTGGTEGAGRLRRRDSLKAIATRATRRLGSGRRRCCPGLRRCARLRSGGGIFVRDCRCRSGPSRSGRA